MSRLRPLLALAPVLGLASLPFAFSEASTRFWQGLLIQIFILAIYALSYDLLLGYTGMVCFGQALFLGGGAYATALLLRLEHPPALPLIVLAVVLLGLLLGALVGLLALRLSGVSFAMLTLALAEAVFILFKSDDAQLKPLTGGELGLQGLAVPAWIDPVTQRLRFYFLALGAMLLLYGLARRLVNSPTGRVLLAIRENEQRAAALGFNPWGYRLVACMASATLAALAGMLLALYNKSVSYELLSIGSTIQALLMTIVGGMGTLLGPMLGAALLQLLDYWLNSDAIRQAAPPWLQPDLLFGLAYIALVLFFPAGLLGALQRRPGGPARGARLRALARSVLHDGAPRPPNDPR